MKRTILIVFLIITGYSFLSAQIPAFPEAEGHGALSKGGRWGRIIWVTTLNDEGPGSLREALEASGPRMILFKVAGYIDLESPIKIRNPYFTIAGQTAPGDGICLRMKPGNDEGIQGLIYAPNSADGLHDVIIRYIKFRQGWTLTYKGNGGPRPHNIYFRSGHDVIIDHVSTEWTRDNLITISLESGATAADSMYNFTVQRCLLGESEEGHSTGMNIQGGTPSGNACGYTGKWVCRVSVHKNLFTGSDHRNPRESTNQVRVINNVIYNWGNRAGSTTRNVKVDIINNYYKAGPMTTDNLYYHRLFHEPWVSACSDQPPGSIYMSGNIMLPHFNPPSDPFAFYEMKTGEPLEDKYKRYEPLPSARYPVTILSVDSAYSSVLADVGCNARLDENGEFVSNVVTDSVDLRMITDVLNGTGFDHEVNKSDWDNGRVTFPEMSAGTPYTDTDNDGMADTWEVNHFGDLTTARYDDTEKTDFDGDGYPDLEEFLNGSDPKVMYTGTKNIFAAEDGLSLRTYPNPASTFTTIEYSLTRAGHVSLKVYDVSGRQVALLIDNQFRLKGRHVYSWDLSGREQNQLKNGIYFIRLTHELESKTSTILVLPGR